MRWFTVFTALMLCAHVAGAEPFHWPDGKRAAIVLTYDDGMASQRDIAIPQLDKAGFKGTFFLNAVSGQDMLLWRAIGKKGHELGNHTMFHPCPMAVLPGRENSTESYTVEKILDEIRTMNGLLNRIDGTHPRTLGYPCSQTIVGGTDYLPALRASGLIAYARTGGDPYNAVIGDLRALDLLNVPSNGPTNEPSGDELIAFVKRVQAAHGLGVLQFHGVGGGYLKVSAEAHQQLLDYLRSQPDIWVGTFQDVLNYVAAHR